MSTEREWIDYYRDNGVVLAECKESSRTSWLLVCDEHAKHYRFRFSVHDGLFHVGISAEWSDDKPGELADYTPRDEYGSASVAGDEISISDDGLLLVMGRQRAASHVDIRIGFTAKLPIEYVTPIRRAVLILREMKERATSNSYDHDAPLYMHAASSLDVIQA
jgi:hypothetical protein